MQISPHIHLVGSEQFGLSHPLDCNCYLIDGGSELALVDAGLGLGNGDILANIAPPVSSRKSSRTLSSPTPTSGIGAAPMASAAKRARRYGRRHWA